MIGRVTSFNSPGAFQRALTRQLMPRARAGLHRTGGQRLPHLPGQVQPAAPGRESAPTQPITPPRLDPRSPGLPNTGKPLAAQGTTLTPTTAAPGGTGPEVRDSAYWNAIAQNSFKRDTQLGQNIRDRQGAQSNYDAQQVLANQALQQRNSQEAIANHRRGLYFAGQQSVSENNANADYNNTIGGLTGALKKAQDDATASDEEQWAQYGNPNAAGFNAMNAGNLGFEGINQYNDAITRFLQLHANDAPPAVATAAMGAANGGAMARGTPATVPAPAGSSPSPTGGRPIAVTSPGRITSHTAAMAHPTSLGSNQAFQAALGSQFPGIGRRGRIGTAYRPRGHR